jgi:hypothetical protein
MQLSSSSVGAPWKIFKIFRKIDFLMSFLEFGPLLCYIFILAGVQIPSKTIELFV